jgi:hypothetical protein
MVRQRKSKGEASKSEMEYLQKSTTTKWNIPKQEEKDEGERVGTYAFGFP